MFITVEDMNKLAEADNYYKATNRWVYIKEVIDLVKSFENVEDLKILEIGPYKSPICVGEDVIDIHESYKDSYPIEINDFINWDCSKTPFPIEDKKYDVIIACQVLEHLGLLGQQREIFKEFQRISHKAIISLPYKWHAPFRRDHHMIDEKVIDSWFNKFKPSFTYIQERRILLYYDFDNPGKPLDLKQLGDDNSLLINNIKKNHKSLKELTKENKRLKKENKKLKSKQKEILSSNSWKLTKPLRKIGKFFK